MTLRLALFALLAGSALGPAPPAFAQTAATTASATFRLGGLTIATPFIRATPKGAPVAGGYLRITNTGSAPDRLIGASFEGARRVDLHEMAMEGGVMRMRPLPQGLEIKPGQTVELTPGGYHLMAMGLDRAYKQGETVKGSLTFEKAGKLAVEFSVMAMGAGAPGASGH